MTARCPMCDREGCPVLAAAQALDASGCDICDRVKAITYAFKPTWEKTQADAAQWRLVAPLIDAMRVALDAGQIVSMRRMFATWGEDSRAALATIDAILAVTEVP